MRVIIAGGRVNTDYKTVEQAVKLSGYDITHIIEGGALGTDRLARQYAKEHNIPTTTVEADWKQYGLNAGPIRNRKMADMADALIALWDGKTKGTRNMIIQAQRKGIKVYVYRLDQQQGDLA